MPDTTNPQPTRYRQRPNEVDAIQWTGDNADALRAFAGIDFDTIDPADRIDDPDCDAQLLVEASHWVGIRPGDWVLKFEGYFIAKDDGPFRAVWEPAAAAAVPSAPADRAALLNAAAQHLYTALFPAVYDDLGQKAAEGVNRAVSELRRMAVEAPAPSRAGGEGRQGETAEVVAYRDPNSPKTLLCRYHGERWQGVIPVTAEELPDGGICTFGRLSSLECGRDVLIPQQPTA